MNSTDFDAIVVGSGISGGWAAKELTERGLRVLVLERGGNIKHGEDYLGEHANSWQFEHYGLPNRKIEHRDYEIQYKSYAFSEATRHFWNNDRLNPYERNSLKPFNWRRTDVVGGRSLLWGRQVYRWSDLDFAANKVDGSGVPWPVSYSDISHWYSHVESFIGVSGQAEGWSHLPDSEFLPPMDYYKIEKTVKNRMRKKIPEIPITMGRVAVLTVPHKGRQACHYCGPCHRGCSGGSYFSSQSSTLPAAKATGRLTLLPNQLVERLEHDESGKRILGVNVIDSLTRRRRRFTGRLVFLCASTLASTQIMLNSSSKRHPDGLGNESQTLGRFLMDHLAISHLGTFVDDVEYYYKGERPNGLYIPRFRNLKNKDDTDFLRGYGYQTHVLRPDWEFRFNEKGFGASFKDKLRRPLPIWVWALRAFIECLPRHENRVYLHPRKKDRFGIPLLVTEFEWSDNERKAALDTGVQAEKILRAAGAITMDINQGEKLDEGGDAIHEMGTARMGADPKTSVVNEFNRVHSIDNLYVTDGSFMSSSSCVNPSLTYMAFTARACEHAVTRLKEESLI